VLFAERDGSTLDKLLPLERDIHHRAARYRPAKPLTTGSDM